MVVTFPFAQFYSRHLQQSLNRPTWLMPKTRSCLALEERTLQILELLFSFWILILIIDPYYKHQCVGLGRSSWHSVGAGDLVIRAMRLLNNILELWPIRLCLQHQTILLKDHLMWHQSDRWQHTLAKREESNVLLRLERERSDPVLSRTSRSNMVSGVHSSCRQLADRFSQPAVPGPGTVFPTLGDFPRSVLPWKEPGCGPPPPQIQPQQTGTVFSQVNRSSSGSSGCFCSIVELVHPKPCITSAFL